MLALWSSVKQLCVLIDLYYLKYEQLKVSYRMLCVRDAWRLQGDWAPKKANHWNFTRALEIITRGSTIKSSVYQPSLQTTRQHTKLHDLRILHQGLPASSSQKQCNLFTQRCLKSCCCFLCAVIFLTLNPEKLIMERKWNSVKLAILFLHAKSPKCSQYACKMHRESAQGPPVSLSPALSLLPHGPCTVPSPSCSSHSPFLAHIHGFRKQSASKSW